MDAPLVTEDLFTSAALADPYPVYERLRAKGSVHLLRRQQLYLVVRHSEILRVLDDPGTFSSNLVGLLHAEGGDVGFADAGGPAVDVLATADPPVHTGHRRIVRPPLRRASVDELGELIDDLLAPRVAALASAGGGDWMADVATPLPVLVIGHILGLPADHAEKLSAWSDAAVELLSGLASPERMGELVSTMSEFMGYLRHHLDQAGATGGVLDTVAVEVADGALTREEAVVMLVQLVTAGAESTTSLIGSAARLLAADPDMQHRLRADPALIEPFIDESLRLESPFRGHFRVTTQVTELGGFQLPRGARLMLLWGSANRDPAAFEDPATLDIDRHATKAHTGFGRGIHFCLGAHLARLEACRALHALLNATDRIAPTPGADADYVPSLFVRRLAHLHLDLDTPKDGRGGGLACPAR